MKRYIRSSVDSTKIADTDRITSGRYKTAVSIEWNVSEDDANRLINGRCNELPSCGYLPLKDSFVSVSYDTDGVAGSKGYLKGFVVTDSYGHRMYYGVADDNHQNIEYITMKKK